MKKRLIYSTFLFLFSTVGATDLYFCTGANSTYFQHLLNLIGSIHHTNYDHLKEIAVFNLGLKDDEIAQLKRIEKIQIYEIEKTHPDILSYFYLPDGRAVFGWYAWKPVAIKQALEKLPYLLWIDSGSTVLKPLDDLFEHIQENGYFLATIGSEDESDKPAYPVRWGTTDYVHKKFNLDSEDGNILLSKDFIMANTLGVSRSAKDLFINPLYELSKDLRNFRDDGTTPNGWGTGRHDQTLLSVICYSQNLKVFKQNYKQEIPITLEINKRQFPFYITWNGSYVCDKTHIYSSRWDLANASYNKSFIRYKHN